jgi:hypothetical protein
MMTMKYLEGFATASNIAKWADRAKGNGYTRDTKQTTKDLNPQHVTTAEDYAPPPARGKKIT